MLIAVKLAHTLIWVFFVGCILAIPYFAWSDRFRYAAVLSAVVLVEVLILAVNRWRCPLTPVAGRYTADRQPNFDIYLPEWLARHNKGIFGSLYVGGLLVMLLRWIGRVP